MSQEQWWAVAGFLSGGIVLGLAARFLLRAVGRRWLRRTPSGADDAVLAAIESRVFLWVLLAGIVLALRSSSAPEFWVRLGGRVAGALFILTLCAAISRILVALLPVASRRFALALPAATLTNNLVQALVFFLGVLMILSNFGVSIGPVLTALGVGSLAVGLALQETLSNIFAGFYLLLFREVRVGDKVDLERGIGYAPHKGTFLDIGWRSSRLDMGDGNFTIVPNSLVTQSIITVYNRNAPPPSSAGAAMGAAAPDPAVKS